MFEMPPGSVVFQSWWVGRIYWEPAKNPLVCAIQYLTRNEKLDYMYLCFQPIQLAFESMQHLWNHFIHSASPCQRKRFPLLSKPFSLTSGSFNANVLWPTKSRRVVRFVSPRGVSEAWINHLGYESPQRQPQIQLLSILLCCWKSLKATDTAKMDCKSPSVMICLIISFFLVNNYTYW